MCVCVSVCVCVCVCVCVHVCVCVCCIACVCVASYSRSHGQNCSYFSTRIVCLYCNLYIYICIGCYNLIFLHIYLSHSALLINTIAIITSSGRVSIHYTSFISVTHTLHLNYYHMQSQYKSVIQFVQQFKNLYAKFEAYLHRNKGLIRNSVLFKSWKFPIV